MNDGFDAASLISLEWGKLFRDLSLCSSPVVSSLVIKQVLKVSSVSSTFIYITNTRDGRVRRRALELREDQ